MTNFVILLALIPVLVGTVLFFLTRKHTYLAFHQKAFQTNPIYRWSLPKSNKNQQRFISLSRIFLRCVGLLAVSFGSIIIFAVWSMHVSPFKGDKFEVLQWEIAGNCQGLSDWECVEKEASCPRGGMVRDLTQNHLILETTSREEAIALLGEHERTIDINGESCAAYSLGMCSGIGIDYDSLYVCYNAENKITATGHVQH